MPLKIKSFKVILVSMADWVTSYSGKLTNFYVGSVVRTLLEAVAIEIEALYFQMAKAHKMAVENAIFESFGFSKYPSLPAIGQLTFNFKYPLSSPLRIPKGYRVSTSAAEGEIVYFEVVDDTIVQTGSISADVNVECTVPGLIGNVPANTVRTPVVRINEVSGITNAQAFFSGTPEETSAERKSRFSKFIQTLGKGTTSAVLYGTLKVPGVQGAYVEEGIGIMNVYAHDASGLLPDALKQEILDSLHDYRPGGIPINLLAVTKKTIDLNIQITLQSGFNAPVYQALVQNAVSAFLSSFPVHKSLTRAELIKCIMGTDVTAISNTTTSLTDDINVLGYELIRPGNIVVTVLQ